MLEQLNQLNQQAVRKSDDVQELAQQLKNKWEELDKTQMGKMAELRALKDRRDQKRYQ